MSSIKIEFSSLINTSSIKITVRKRVYQRTTVILIEDMFIRELAILIEDMFIRELVI
jgi:hypothetical protein